MITYRCLDVLILANSSSPKVNNICINRPFFTSRFFFHILRIKPKTFKRGLEVEGTSIVSPIGSNAPGTLGGRKKPDSSKNHNSYSKSLCCSVNSLSSSCAASNSSSLSCIDSDFLTSFFVHLADFKIRLIVESLACFPV
jgi:hypothetical protein